MAVGGQVEPARPRVIPSLRWWIGGILFASTVINYIDRQTLSILAPFLKQDYHWTNVDYANIAIAFRIAYTVGQTLCGRLMDRVGTRRGLTISVTWYSIVSLLTSLANGISSFAVFRFLLGAGESANWPGASKAVSEWFPKRERGLAAAFYDSGSSFASDSVASVSGLSGTGAGIGTIIAFELIGHFSDARQASVTHSFDPIVIAAGLIPFVGMILVLLLVRNTRATDLGLVRRI